jgi:RNA recognition motif-containing protein
MEIDTHADYTLYVHNLNDQIPLEKLKENLYIFFSTYGEVLDINMKPELRGQAFVMFTSNQGAKHALRGAQGDVLFGKSVKVEWAKSEAKRVEALK